jgi:DNA-binding GntR family transcriptional regulator
VTGWHSNQLESFYTSARWHETWLPKRKRLFNNREVTMTLSLSLADQIALELRADIIGGRLLPGMPLIEVELVKAYNASRNTIREALHRLGQEGLTRYVRNKGVMVRRLECEEVRDLFVVRRTLELQAIAQSGPLTEAQSERMQNAIDATTLAREREDWRAVATHSLMFHQQVVGLMRSPLFDEFFCPSHRPVASGVLRCA